MSLISPDALRARCLKLWDSQRFLRAWLAGEPLFPFEISLGTPSGAALASRYAEVGAWIEALRAASKAARGHGYVLDEQEVAHRQLGTQRLPVRAILETPDDLLALIGKRQAFARFRALADATRERLPALLPYLEARPLAVLELEAAWLRVLDVCAHFQAHPRPGCYPRQLTIPGVDSKFIEAHEALLWELLPLALPPDAYDAGVLSRARHGFARRYGLRHEEATIRFRVLDEGLAVGGFTDLEVPASAFAEWRSWPLVEAVYVTENKVNGLAFPPVPGAICVFGLGYGVATLAEVPWLAEVDVGYWGDIDTHGYAILDRLRDVCPHARSLLMDEATLLAHRAAWGEETRQRSLADLARLTDAERAVYDGLRADRWAPRLRLEQERIAYDRVLAALGLP